MKDFYTHAFEEMVGNEPWIIEKITFATELIFIVKK
jgi:hypothetical protein